MSGGGGRLRQGLRERFQSAVALAVISICVAGAGSGVSEAAPPPTIRPGLGSDNPTAPVPKMAPPRFRKYYYHRPPTSPPPFAPPPPLAPEKSSSIAGGHSILRRSAKSWQFGEQAGALATNDRGRAERCVLGRAPRAAVDHSIIGDPNRANGLDAARILVER